MYHLVSFLDMCNTSRLCTFRLLNFTLAARWKEHRQTGDEHALAQRRCIQNKYHPLFLRHSHVRERNNIMWSNSLIIQLSSLFLPQPPISDPKPAVSLSTSNSLFYLYFLHTHSSLLDRGMGEIIIMF